MQARESRYYEDIELGDEIGPIEKYITDEEVAAFCRLWGAPVPNRFTDEGSATQVNLSWPIVPGIMSMAIMSQVFTSWEGVAVKHLDVVFRQPVPHALVSIMAIVTDKREEEGEHLAECDVYLSTEENGRLVGGKATIGLPSYSDAEASTGVPDDEELEDDDLVEEDEDEEEDEDLDDDDDGEDQPEDEAPSVEELATDDSSEDGSNGQDEPVAEEPATDDSSADGSNGQDEPAAEEPATDDSSADGSNGQDEPAAEEPATDDSSEDSSKGQDEPVAEVASDEQGEPGEERDDG